MFEKLFTPKPRLTPQEFASKLLSIWCAADMNPDFTNLLSLSEPEKRRYDFTMFLFTAMMPSTMAVTSGKNHLLPFTTMTCALMMNVWDTKDKDSLVRLGDYVVTGDEYGYLGEALGEHWFHEGFCEAELMNRQIRFGTLLDKIGFIRGKQQIKEVFAEAQTDPQATPTAMADNLSVKYGIQLQGYICDGSFGSTKEMSASSTTAQWQEYIRESMKRSFPPGRSREELLSRTMIFTSLARAYCKRISDVYFTAIP